MFALRWFQDYAEAARLRDMVKSLQGEDPVVRLQTLMEKAIADEQYIVSSAHTIPSSTVCPIFSCIIFSLFITILLFVQEAARYRDELSKVSPPKVGFGLHCHSDTTTNVRRCKIFGLLFTV